MPVENGIDNSVTCPFVQAEPYYLKAAFDELKKGVVLSPVLDFSKGYEQALESFLELGRTLGIPAGITRKAFSLGVRAQEDFHRECREMGRLFLKERILRPHTYHTIEIEQDFEEQAKINMTRELESYEDVR